MIKKLLLACGLSTILSTAWGAEYKILVPVAPGGIMDAAVKTVQERVSAHLRSPVKVEFYPGAAGKLARNQLEQQTRKGEYVVMIDQVAFWIQNPDPAFIPVSYFGTAPNLIIARKGWTPPDGFDICESTTRLTYGTAGINSGAHFVMKTLPPKCLDIFAHVPYKGASLALTDLLGGYIDLAVVSWQAAQPFVRSGDATVVFTVNGVTADNHAWKQFPPTLANHNEIGDPTALFFITHQEADKQKISEFAQALTLVYSDSAFTSAANSAGFSRGNESTVDPGELFRRYTTVSHTLNKNQ